ncbi:hypothetical protein FTW19_06060 [Terriglobus albidus]|uniref:DUF1571 domain-containing protein n=1 Tax=Terriglobus albidus TaxID=1592106 RepID=A0A5B9E5S9_9BACT|nr:hypothetical protein [Terriglobus albidus]QEE27602.1 hypothetical protein FTW19_06060 [Terriglobus albidus]
MFRFFLLSFFGITSTAFAADRIAPPPQEARVYAAVDIHAEEKVAIAAEPCDTVQRCPFFREHYQVWDFFPIRIIITNDSDRTLTLDEVRMHFISSHNDRIPAATEMEVYRRITAYRRNTRAIESNIALDFDQFGFRSTLVAPHSTASGYLLYDLEGIKQPFSTGQIYVKEVMVFDKKGNRELYAFEIPLAKYVPPVSGTKKP